MMKNKSIRQLSPLFIDTFPEELQNGVLYISIRFNSMVHLCACGCQEETHTPIRSSEWSLTYNGKEVSLNPSIGNFSFDCKSHYWIKANHIIWAKPLSLEEIRYVREKEMTMRNQKEKNIISRIRSFLIKK